MTDQNDFIKRVVAHLEKAGIEYMLSGSFGSSYHGHPRATNDTDIIINPTREQLHDFVDSLGPDYYVSKPAAFDALANHGMFNIIDIQMSWKADLIIRKRRPFSIAEFSRRQRSDVLGEKMWVLSPEDSILSKLEWSRERQSTAQSNDVLGVMMVQWENLDLDYLRKWAEELKVSEQLEQLLRLIEIKIEIDD